MEEGREGGRKGRRERGSEEVRAGGGQQWEEERKWMEEERGW